MIALDVSRTHDIDQDGVEPLVVVTITMYGRHLLRWTLTNEMALDLSWRLQRAVHAPLETL